MRKIYYEELQRLTDSVVNMGENIVDRLDGCTNVLSLDTTDSAKSLIKTGEPIIELEKDISNQAVALINSQQPVATDLRKIISIIKISYDLLRISENIDNIAETRKRVQFTGERVLIRLKTMESLCRLMLNDVYTAYIENDLDLLREVHERDKDIDALFVQITTSDIYESTDAFVTGQSQLTAKYLERMGDHIKNIAEHVFYVITAKQLDE